MTTEQVERAFDPFYSTKATGTGLGLAITRQILEDHDGTVRVASSPGRGATVTLVLPQRPAAPSSTGRSAAAGVTGGSRPRARRGCCSS